MSHYGAQDIRQLDEGKDQALSDLAEAWHQVVTLSFAVKSADARAYLAHGVARRLKLIQRCFSNIFDIFPPEREDLLDKDSLSDLNINLHAFVLHVNAVEDNLAWAFEREFSLNLDRHAVSLFRRKLSQHLPERARSWLARPEIKAWHADYSTNFRDALAHRIPLYVPPAVYKETDAKRAGELDEAIRLAAANHDWYGVEAALAAREELGEVCVLFLHSFTESKPMYLHAQIIADANTVSQMCRVIVEGWVG